MNRIALALCLSFALPSLAGGITLVDWPVRSGSLVPEAAPSVDLDLQPELHEKGSAGWIVGGAIGGATTASMAAILAVVTFAKIGSDNPWLPAGLTASVLGAGLGSMLGYYAREGSFAAKVGLGILWGLGAAVVVSAAGLGLYAISNFTPVYGY